MKNSSKGDWKHCADVRAQMGALCYDVTGSELRVLLITSRGTGRWIVPKGWPMADRGAAGTAQQEAWEEAGVIGDCSDISIGAYPYFKIMDDGAELPCLVQLYPLKVQQLVDDFPERHERRRQWFSPQRAAELVDEAELAQILRNFDPQKENS